MLRNKKLLVHNNIPADMQRVIGELKQAKNKEACLRQAYDTLTTKYCGGRGLTYTKIHHLAISDIEKLWNKEGFMHCTNINYLLKFLLVASGLFTEDDIIVRWTHIWYVSPHQYLKVRVKDNEYVNIDIWAKFCNIEFGDFARGFH